MSSPSSFGSGTEFGTTPLGTSPFFHVKELIDGILNSTGHTSPDRETTKRKALLNFINMRYQEICMARHWRWLDASYDVTLESSYETGNASATKGSTTVTGVGTLWSAVIQPKDLFFFNNSSISYHVASIESNTSLTLESEFSDEDETLGEYTIARNQYKLPKETDTIKQIIIEGLYRPVTLMGKMDFRTLQSRDSHFLGQPYAATLSRRETDDDATYLEVYPAPDKQYQVHIDYNVRILRLDDRDDCYPIIPDRYRAVLYYGALADFFTFQKDPSNAAITYNMYQGFLTQMKQDKQLTDQDLTMRAGLPTMRRRGNSLNRITMSIEDFGKID